MLTSKPVKVAKVLICGMKDVGKTTILEQLIYGNTTDITPTIEDIYVASIDTGKGTRDNLRIYDTAGLHSSAQLPRHYFSFPEGFILVYDPLDPASLDILGGIKADIDRYKEKKEACIIVIANMRPKMRSPSKKEQTPDPVESILTRANNWCARERIKHYCVNAMERASLYEPFIQLAIKLHPAPNKSTLSQFKQLAQKTTRTEA